MTAIQFSPEVVQSKLPDQLPTNLALCFPPPKGAAAKRNLQKKIRLINQAAELLRRRAAVASAPAQGLRAAGTADTRSARPTTLSAREQRSRQLAHPRTPTHTHLEPTHTVTLDTCGMHSPIATLALNVYTHIAGRHAAGTTAEG